jgi:hypothetical protein
MSWSEICKIIKAKGQNLPHRKVLIHGNYLSLSLSLSLFFFQYWEFNLGCPPIVLSLELCSQLFYLFLFIYYLFLARLGLEFRIWYLLSRCTTTWARHHLFLFWGFCFCWGWAGLSSSHFTVPAIVTMPGTHPVFSHWDWISQAFFIWADLELRSSWSQSSK